MVYVTHPDMECAKRISDELVKEKLVALEPIEDNVGEIFIASKLENEAKNKVAYDMSNVKLELYQKRKSPNDHPLVKAGLILDTLIEILTVLEFEAKSKNSSTQNCRKRKHKY